MWSCDRSNLKISGPIVQVLNGDYPEADVKRMSLYRLEKLVARLVLCTAEVAGAKTASKPIWWPNGIVFSYPINLGVKDHGEIRILLKQLIINCSQFFKNREWNDENRKGIKRIRNEKILPRKRYKAFVQISPFVPVEDTPSKNQFLNYFKLNSNCCKVGDAATPPVTLNVAKLTSCINIPFSSDVGRIMAERENHHMPEDLKLKRLERSEWYTNKTTPKQGDVDYETCSYKEVSDCHIYKFPKRQFHQKRHSLHNPEFLLQFCTPLHVNLDRLDLDKVKSDTKKKLVVMIDNTEKNNCGAKKETKIVRISPRLRNV